jgi:CDGSH-type Zn-finger protein
MARKDAVVITPYRDGPLLVRGPIELTWPDGRRIETLRNPVALCRCGKSQIQPFCDGTHKLARFRSDLPGDLDAPPADQASTRVEEPARAGAPSSRSSDVRPDAQHSRT